MVLLALVAETKLLVIEVVTDDSVSVVDVATLLSMMPLPSVEVADAVLVVIGAVVVCVAVEAMVPGTDVVLLAAVVTETKLPVVEVVTDDIM